MSSISSHQGTRVASTYNGSNQGSNVRLKEIKSKVALERKNNSVIRGANVL